MKVDGGGGFDRWGGFFFKQKTAYEMLRSLVGSEMCIRDSVLTVSLHADPADYYPFYWGSETESGEGEGKGYNLSLIHI